MEISFWHQASLPLLSLIFGLIAGVLYDAVRILRCCLGIKYRHSIPTRLSDIKLPLINNGNKEGRLKKVKENLIMFFTDILYFVILTCLMCIFVYAVNNGKIRWYIYFFSFVGFLIYYFTLGKLIIKVSSVFSFILCSILLYLRTFICAPINCFIKGFKEYSAKRRADLKINKKNKKNKNIRTELLKIGKAEKP